MKKSIIAVLSLLAASACANLIEISVTGTAQETKWGYTAGQSYKSYTFTWTLNDGYTGGSMDSFNSSDSSDLTRWTAVPIDNPLWTNVKGDGLKEDYTRPIEPDSMFIESIVYDSGTFSLLAGMYHPIGLETITGGYDVISVGASGLNIGEMTHPKDFVDPATWLEQNSKIGHTWDNPGGEMFLTTSDGEILFTPTSVTIAAIPEPAAVTTTVLTAIAALFIRRRCSVALSLRR